MQRKMKLSIVACLLAIVAVLAPLATAAEVGSAAERIPVPQGLFPAVVTQDSPKDVLLKSFVGIPYRVDGAVNARGEYTLFARPEERFSTPGLNCSGLVLAAARFLLGKNFTLEEVMRDRAGDSGPDSAYGQDWDFGWDVLMNISEGYERSLLLPGNQRMDPARATAFAPRGFDLQADATWRELPGRLRQGYMYLLSLNVEGRRKGYGLVHYHVGFIHVASDGKAWLYQTTGRGKAANRRNVADAEGIASFRKAFANSGKNRRMLWVLEVKMP